MSAPKLCPFCDCNYIDLELKQINNKKTGFAYLQCAGCGARTKSFYFEYKDDPHWEEKANRAIDLAVAAWNRRADTKYRDPELN